MTEAQGWFLIGSVVLFLSLLLVEVAELKRILREIRDEMLQVNSSSSEGLSVLHGVLESVSKARAGK